MDGDVTAGGDVPEVQDQVLGGCGRSGQRRPSVCVNSLTAEHTRVDKSRPGQVFDRWNHTRRTLDSTTAPTLDTSGRTLDIMNDKLLRPRIGQPNRGLRQNSQITIQLPHRQQSGIGDNVPRREIDGTCCRPNSNSTNRRVAFASSPIVVLWPTACESSPRLN